MIRGSSDLSQILCIISDSASRMGWSCTIMLKTPKRTETRQTTQNTRRLCQNSVNNCMLAGDMYIKYSFVRFSFYLINESSTYTEKNWLLYCHVPARWGLQQTTLAPGKQRDTGQGSSSELTGGQNLTPTGEPSTCGVTPVDLEGP